MALHAILEQPLLDVLLGVRIDRDFLAQPFESCHAFEQIVDIGDWRIQQRLDDLLGLLVQFVGRQQPQLGVGAIMKVHREFCPLVATPVDIGGETPLDLCQGMQDVLAGAQRVGAEIGARAIRFAALFAAQGQPVRLAGRGAGQQIVRPRLAGIGRLQLHLLGPRPFRAFLDRTLDEFFLAQAFDGRAFGRRRRQAERHLLFQDQRERRSGMLARHFAGRAIPVQPLPRFRHQSDRDNRIAAP